MTKDDIDEHDRIPVKIPLIDQPAGIIKSWHLMRQNVLNIVPAAATTEKTLSGRTGKRWHMIMDPSCIQRMLIERLQDYPKSTVTKNLLRPAIGESLFIAEGAEWRWQRRTSAPAFSHRSVTGLGPVMIRAAENCATRIAQAGPRAINMLDEMIATTFDVIADVTFSGDGSFHKDTVHDAIDSYVSDAGHVSLLDVLGAPDWIPRPGRMASSDTMEAMRRDADAAIERRAAQRKDTGSPDLLDLLLDGQDPQNGRRMSTSELRDNLLTFIVARHENTALTLAWSFYLCAFDPQVQERARQQAQTVLGRRAATAEDLPQLTFIRQIVGEALRLYPPAGMVSRTARAYDRLGDAEIRPGDTVMIPIYALGRHKRFWERPDHFDPARFTDRKSIPRFAYLPFGDGPRICIGASFAVQEAVIILATLLARFRFQAVPGRAPQPVMILTLRPEGGVWLTAKAC